MLRNKSRLSAALALGCAAIPAPAQAQWTSFIPDMIAITIMNMNSGQGGCMTGATVGEKEIAEARDPAPAVMQGYFAAAGGGGAKNAWFKTTKKAKWQAGTVSADLATMNAAADPLAAAGNRLDPVPLRFYRSGNYSTALGQWAVLDPAGAVAGVYTALFEREKGAWKLKELLVSQAGETVAPSAQYCLAPGDVTQFRLTGTADWVAGAQKRVAKAETKLAEADVKAAVAEAAAAAAPKNAGRTALAREARALAKRRGDELAAKRKELADATAAEAKARGDAAELAALTGPAREALRFRLPPAEPAATGAAR